MLRPDSAVSFEVCLLGGAPGTACRGVASASTSSASTASASTALDAVQLLECRLRFRSKANLLQRLRIDPHRACAHRAIPWSVVSRQIGLYVEHRRAIDQIYARQAQRIADYFLELHQREPNRIRSVRRSRREKPGTAATQLWRTYLCLCRVVPVEVCRPEKTCRDSKFVSSQKHSSAQFSIVIVSVRLPDKPQMGILLETFQRLLRIDGSIECGEAQGRDRVRHHSTLPWSAKFCRVD